MVAVAAAVAAGGEKEKGWKMFLERTAIGLVALLATVIIGASFGYSMDPGKTEIPDEVVATLTPSCAPWDGAAMSLVAEIPPPVGAVLRVMVWKEGLGFLETGRGFHIDINEGMTGVGHASLCSPEGQNCRFIKVWIKTPPKGHVYGRIILENEYYLPHVRIEYKDSEPLCG